MKLQLIARGVAASLVLALAGAGGVAFADGSLYERLREMRAIDRDRNAMVSKAEMMEMIGKAYDMKAREMGAKGGEMTEAQFRAFLKSLYIGG